MGKVEVKVQDGSMWQLHLDVTGAPDTSHPEHPGASLRPAGISMGIGITDGAWSVSAVNVFGLKVKDGKVVTKRNYPMPFLDPLGPDSVAPEWLQERCQEWVDRANGVGSKPAPVPVEKERSPQRKAFDTALNVLLIRENLDGTEWAIKRLREAADHEPNDERMAALMETADALEARMDMRAAQLAAENWG